ncbi:MAG: translation initiation factor 2, partial [Thioclava sp.]|nr:translation initiation factor 2 [Thioclava sp.]
VDQGALDPALQPHPELQDARPTARPEAVTRFAASQAPAGEPAAAANPQLAEIRPERRPATIQEAVQGAVAAQDAAAAANSDPFAGATALAVARSANPPEKPRNFSRSVERALAAAIAAEPAPSVAAAAAAAPAAAPKAQPVEIDEPEPVAPAPKLPTSASVAKQATEKNAINLRKINLIGLYGSSSNRRALVRLANGRFVKVGVGDRLDGGQVTAIGSGQLTYKKGSRSYTLKLLEGS